MVSIKLSELPESRGAFNLRLLRKTLLSTWDMLSGIIAVMMSVRVWPPLDFRHAVSNFLP